MKILGVTIQSNLRFSAHVAEVITSANQSLYALRSLKAHGLGDNFIRQIYSAIVLSKLLYCSPAWWGFCTKVDINRLESTLRKAHKAQFYCLREETTFQALATISDSKLFRKALLNNDHVLHCILPPPTAHEHNLRPRAHNLTLTQKTSALDESNFIPRMLFNFKP